MSGGRITSSGNATDLAVTRGGGGSRVLQEAPTWKSEVGVIFIRTKVGFSHEFRSGIGNILG